MKKIAVLLSLVYIFIFAAGFQPPPCYMKVDGRDPFHPIFYPEKKDVFTFGVYRWGNDKIRGKTVPVWEIIREKTTSFDDASGSNFDFDTLEYGSATPGFKVTHSPENLVAGVRYEALVWSDDGYCSRKFEIVEKHGGFELGQCPPDTTERAERDGCLFREIWYLQERLPNGDWVEPNIVPAPEHMGGGWQPMTCREYHSLFKRQVPFEIEGMSFDPKEICFLDDPRIDGEAGILTRIAYDSRDASAGLDPEHLDDEGYFVFFYCIASANQGKKCSCSEEDINIPDGILNCAE